MSDVFLRLKCQPSKVKYIYTFPEDPLHLGCSHKAYACFRTWWRLCRVGETCWWTSAPRLTDASLRSLRSVSGRWVSGSRWTERPSTTRRRGELRMTAALRMSGGFGGSTTIRADNIYTAFPQLACVQQVHFETTGKGGLCHFGEVANKRLCGSEWACGHTRWNSGKTGVKLSSCCKVVVFVSGGTVQI